MNDLGLTPALIPTSSRTPNGTRRVIRRRVIRWRKKYGGVRPSELKRLKQLEEENSKLKRLVADLSLDKAMLQDVLSRKLRKPELVSDLMKRFGASLRQACAVVKLSKSVYLYRSQARMPRRLE